MHQGQVPALHDVFTLKTQLEAEWSERIAALTLSGAALNLFEDLDDDELKAKAEELGVTVGDDDDRETILKAVNDAAKKKAPWTADDFDPERAWKLIQGVRSDLDRIKNERDELRTRVKEHDDATKSDVQKLTERAEEAEKCARTAEQEVMRLRIALRKNLTETQARRLVGDTEEALEADADELLSSFTSNDDHGDDDPLRRGPTPRLRPGAVSGGEPEENDPKKLAEQVPRPY